jgi:hypothetical protein
MLRKNNAQLKVGGRIFRIGLLLGLFDEGLIGVDNFRLEMGGGYFDGSPLLRIRTNPATAMP